MNRAIETLSRWIAWAENLTGVSQRGMTALLILVVGLLLAWVLALVARRVTHRLVRALPGGGVLATEMDRPRVPRTVGRVVFWGVVVVTMMTATETLGWPVVTQWLSGVATYLPRIVVAMVIMAAGLTVGRLTRAAVVKAGGAWQLHEPELLGRVAQGAVVAAAALVTVEQLGIGVTLLTTGLTVVAAALLGAGALAFGLGSRDAVSNILAAHYVRQAYQIGHRLRIDEVEGRLVHIGTTMVTLDCEAGQLAIPARRFLQTNSLRIGESS